MAFTLMCFSVSFIVFLVFNSVMCVYNNVDYCSLCSNHTMCIYKGLGSKCGYTSTAGFLSEDEKKTIVDTHNKLRAFVANGGEGRGNPGPQPPASDMQQLEWDEELARTAQAWADQCDFGHDACRIDPRFPVGQNAFLSEGGVPWEQAILSWYSEVQFMDKAIVDNFIFDEVTGHYAQLIWGNTRYIGCGKRTYPQKLKKYFYKRDTSQVDELEPNFQNYQNHNTIRQTRKINNGQYNKRNYDFSLYTQRPQKNDKSFQNNYKNVAEKDTKTYNKYNNYDFSSFTQKPKTQKIASHQEKSTSQTSANSVYSFSSKTTTEDYKIKTDSSYTQYGHDYRSEQNGYVDELKKYGEAIQQYYEKYENHLKNSEDLNKQLQLYKNYLDQMKQLDSPYLSYEQKTELFYELQKKHDLLKKIHQRQVYHDQVLKDKISKTKKLNPYVPKEYSFSTETPVVPGQIFEYYVCNYGPTGLWPGARMYTTGSNNCQYGLCKDPLTVSYYPGTDKKNDPILAILYENNK